MRLIAKFVGKNRDFRDWLAAGMPKNVVSLVGYREQRKSRPMRGGYKINNFDPSIA